MEIKNYTVFDIETPNKRNTSLCSISIINVKDEKIVFEKEYLVNPEDYFDDFNIELTGITPQMVKNAPTFDKVWEKIKVFFTNGIVVGHNINAFDLRVICNSLNRYNIVVPDIYFIDTLYVSKKAFIGLENYKLNTICKKFDIINEHPHNSLWDTKVNQKLFEKILETNILNESDVRLYRYVNNISKEKIDRSTNKIHGIIADKQLKEQENIYMYSGEAINFYEKNVCLTGNFTHGSRRDIEKIIEDKGGIIQPQVTSKLDILIVGGEGSKDWSYGSYGGKIKKAMELNEKGKNIKIISEDSIF